MFSKTLVTGVVRPEPAVLHLASNPACLLLRPLQTSSLLYRHMGRSGGAREGTGGIDAAGTPSRAFSPSPAHFTRLPPQEQRGSRSKTERTRTTWQVYFSRQAQAPPPQRALPGVWRLFFPTRTKNRLHLRATWQHHLPPGWRHLPVPYTVGSRSHFLNPQQTPTLQKPPRPPTPRHSTALSPQPYLPSPAGPRRSPCCRLGRSSCRPSESPRAARRPRSPPFPLGRRRDPSHRDGCRPAGGAGSEWTLVGSAVKPQSWRESRVLPRRRSARAVSQRTAPAHLVPPAQARRQPRSGVT